MFRCLPLRLSIPVRAGIPPAVPAVTIPATYTRPTSRLLFPACLLLSFGIPHSSIRLSVFKIRLVGLPRLLRSDRALVVSEIESSSSFHPTGKPTSYSVVRFHRSPSFGFQSQILRLGAQRVATFAPHAPVNRPGRLTGSALAERLCFPRCTHQTSPLYRQPDRRTIFPVASRASTSEPAYSRSIILNTRSCSGARFLRLSACRRTTLRGKVGISSSLQRRAHSRASQPLRGSANVA